MDLHLPTRARLAPVRRLFRSGLRHLPTRHDAVAGVVLGVQSVPDGLATGLLAGVSPLAGLYAYMVGTISGALLTSSVFMVVQGTGAMAILIADVHAVHHAVSYTHLTLPTKRIV